MLKPIATLVLALAAAILIVACGAASTATPQVNLPSPTTLPGASATPAATATAAGVPTATPSSSQVPPTVAPTSTEAPTGAPVAGKPTPYPPVPTGIPVGILPTAGPPGNFVAFAWNNLGMHCYQNDFSQFMILPPYNVFLTQVIDRSGEDPRIATSGLTVSYEVPTETQPASHNDFWQHAAAYGFNLQPGIGLTGKGTSGTMDAATDHFTAAGVPAVDVGDDGVWDPFPFFLVKVQRSGQTAAQTFNVAPVSTEMSCYLCHQGNTTSDVMLGILKAHDASNGTGFAAQAQGGKPVLCDTCHADPAMGVTQSKGSKFTLSGAMHTFHADKMTGSQLPQNVCYSCHPGPSTQCLRDVMFSVGIICTDCHGTMADVGDSARTPWVNLPACQSCHGQNLGKATTTHIDNPNQQLTATSDALYQNSKGHGGGGIYCSACHGSTHAVYPTTTERDNQQSIYLQGHSGFINTCTVCHQRQPDEPFFHVRGGE